MFYVDSLGVRHRQLTATVVACLIYAFYADLIVMLEEEIITLEWERQRRLARFASLDSQARD